VRLNLQSQFVAPAKSGGFPIAVIPFFEFAFLEIAAGMNGRALREVRSSRRLKAEGGASSLGSVGDARRP
jgi:hypothetical protein